MDPTMANSEPVTTETISTSKEIAASNENKLAKEADESNDESKPTQGRDAEMDTAMNVGSAKEKRKREDSLDSTNADSKKQKGEETDAKKITPTVVVVTPVENDNAGLEQRMSTEMDTAMDAGCAREERKRADSLDFNTAGSKSNEETQSKKTTKVNLPTPAGASPNSVSQTTVGISTISPVEHLAALLVNLLQAGAPASGRLQEAP